MEPLKSVGAPFGSSNASKIKGDNVTINSDQPKAVRGNSTDYLLAKIKRDRPDIAQRLSDGEFKSVRHAF